VTQARLPKPDLSVVIPAFNEAIRLPETLRRLEAFCVNRSELVQVIVADDGSTDDTVAVARTFADRLNLRVVSLSKNSGAGAALSAGVKAASGKNILICDADGPVPFEHISRLERAIELGSQIAVGSRLLKHSSSKRPQPLFRQTIGKVWVFLVQFILPLNVRDTQCGFKLFTRGAAHRIFASLQEKGFAFHVESLLLAQEYGYKIKEVPIHWDDSPGSKINLLKDPITMFWGLLRIRQNYPAAGLSRPEEQSHGR